ncbi:hypothetical protein C0Q70_04709 [Pomacea canaliculata]|uniref:Uncharacterized protein n=1 Tax=Pomacea canaliculata TaxID=400727 RepID=A0A2T7PJ42_POMCA|nr:hypothetical protein C0Q70_04709 [Pomacea canaliculata]
MTVSFGDDQVFGKRCEITDRFTGTAHRIAERWTLMLSLALGVLIMISSYVHIGYQLYRQKKRREIALYMELQGKFRKEEDKNWKGFLAKVTEDQEVKVKTKDASSGFISEDFVELSKDVKTTTSEFLLSQKELASANMETVDTSLTVKTDVRMITVGTAATSPGVDATVPSSTVETFATSAGDHSTVTSAGDSSTVAVHLGNCDVKKTKESKSRHMGTKIQSRTTLMMFIITVTAIVAYLPYVVVAGQASEYSLLWIDVIDICHPLRRHLSPRQALYLVLVSLALSSAASFPFFPLRNIVIVKTGKDHVFGKRCDITVEFASPQLRTTESLTY